MNQEIGQNLLGTSTVLIDRTSDSNYIYVGIAKIYKNTAPATNEKLWQITRITLSSGNATEVKNAHSNGKPGQFFKWDDRLDLNYI